MKFDDGIFRLYSKLYENPKDVELSMEEYLGRCSDDPSYYVATAERMRGATSGNWDYARLRRVYDAIECIALDELGLDVYPMQEAIIDTSQNSHLGRIFMSQQFFGKSSLAGRLKQLVETEPVYVLRAGREMESPLGFSDPVTLGPELQKRYGIPQYAN